VLLCISVLDVTGATEPPIAGGLLNFPATGRNQFDGVSVGVAEVNAMALAGAVDLAFDADARGPEVIAPRLYI
jgi:hypothetical protein